MMTDNGYSNCKKEHSVKLYKVLLLINQYLLKKRKVV